MLEWKTCLKGGITVMAVYLLIHYWSGLTRVAMLAIGAAFPLILGCIIAYVVNILMSFYERLSPEGKKVAGWKKLRRPVCMLLAFASVVLVLFLIIRMILPELAECIQLLLERLPGEMHALYLWLEENLQLSEWLSDEAEQIYSSNFHNVDWQDMLRQSVQWLLTGVGGAMSSVLAIVSSLFSKAVTLLVAFVFAIYLLTGKERLGRHCCLLMQTYCGKN